MSSQAVSARLKEAPSGRYSTLPLSVGNTPLTFISEPFVPGGGGFWAKLEGFNPGGIKDRPALHMVRRARARGDLQPGATVAESTSGTLGLGLALA
ncbi:pyridoxal-phosphate dependent enzyme [Nonomuraea ferruginea]